MSQKGDLFRIHDKYRRHDKKIYTKNIKNEVQQKVNKTKYIHIGKAPDLIQLRNGDIKSHCEEYNYLQVLGNKDRKDTKETQNIIKQRRLFVKRGNEIWCNKITNGLIKKNFRIRDIPPRCIPPSYKSEKDVAIVVWIKE